MVKFLHTADWHIGMKATRLGKAAEPVRAARLGTVARMLEAATARGVDFVLVAGDLFENNGMSESIVRDTLEVLARSGDLPIYILPGNHDPLMADSVYLRGAWKRDAPSNVKVLEARELLALDDLGAVIYPCPVKQKVSRSDPTGWILKEETPAIRIGLAHGNLATGAAGDNPNFPIAPDRAALSGLDYLALGEWHSHLVHGDGRTVYPGAPEQTAFGERESGCAVIVSIDAPGTMPRLEILKTGQYEWLELEEEISSQEDLDRLLQRIRDLHDPQHTLMRAVIKGAVAVDVKEAAHGLEAQATGLAFLEVDTEHLHIRPDPATLLALMPGGATKETMRSLLLLIARDRLKGIGDLMTQEDAEGRLRELADMGDALHASPAVLERAIEHLYTLSKEVGR
jgi:DNA repair exonuclease SbcCD nuclease subunit